MPRSLADRIAPIWPTLLLFAVTLAAYSSVFGHEFSSWDDHLYVTDNETIRGLSWTHLKAAFTTFYVSNYAPVQIVSYMFDYTLWGLWASGFLLTNVLLHASNGVLFYHLLAAHSRSQVWPLVAALCFLLHPVQVESVAWISQRKNLLAMLFFLGAFQLYRRYRQGGKQRGLCYGLALFAYLLALLAKSVAIVLAPVLVLYDLCYDQDRPWRQLLADKLPFVAASGAVAWLAVISQGQGGGIAEQYPGGSLLTGIMTMLPVLARYLGLLLWPSDLSIWYSPPIKTGLDLAVVGAGGLFLALLVLGWLLFRWRRPMFFWYALFFIGLLPVSQIVPMVTLMNDRYLYFPMLGAAAFLTAPLFATMEFADWRRSNRHLTLAICTGLALALLAGVTARRIAVWENSLTVWQDAVAHHPDASSPYYNLGLALLNEGRFDEAIPPLEMANGLEANQGDTLKALGIALAQKGNYSRAITMFAAATRVDPNDPAATQDLENAKRMQLEAGARP